MEAAETVVLFTDSFREKLCSKFPKAGKKIIGAILAGGAVVGLISSIVENHYSSKALMEKNKLNNTKRVLRHMSSDIAAKNYKGGNYYFVSTNYGVGEADAIGTFAKKEGIKYNVEYDDTYFNKIKEHADNILKTIDDESFFKHKTYEYNKTLNNTIKTVKKIAIGADLLAKGVSLAKKHGWDLNKIKEWLKKQGETEDLDEKAESIKELTDSNYIDVLSNLEKNNEKFKELQVEKIKLDVPNVGLPTATPAA